MTGDKMDVQSGGEISRQTHVSEISYFHLSYSIILLAVVNCEGPDCSSRAAGASRCGAHFRDDLTRLSALNLYLRPFAQSWLTMEMRNLRLRNLAPHLTKAQTRPYRDG